MAVLQVNGLRKRFERIVAVDELSLNIAAGEIYGLLGPNGAGKTTTISMIAGLLAPDAGTVRVGDGKGDPRRRIGLVPQELALTEKLTARECLLFVGRLYDLRGRDLRARVEKRLVEVGLTDRADDRVSTFSGGMQRRLNIAAALLHDPALVLLDEPTAGVDPQARVYIFEIVEQLASAGAAVLYTTHYMEEAQRLCRRIGIMDHGRLLAEGTLAELTDQIDARRELVITADGLDDASAQRMSEALAISPCTRSGDTLRLPVTDGPRALIDAVRAADRIQLAVRGVTLDEPNLEAVFLKLTGRGLRD
jgi:ABC-2 type transport system ATP-binding protein